MLFSDLERKLRDEISIETSQIKTSENEEKTETEKKLKIECGEVDVVSLEEKNGLGKGTDCLICGPERYTLMSLKSFSLIAKKKKVNVFLMSLSIY